MSAPRHWSSPIASVLGGFNAAYSNQSAHNTLADSSNGEEELVDFANHTFSTLDSKLGHQERLVERAQKKFEALASESVDHCNEREFQASMTELAASREELESVNEQVEARMKHGMDLVDNILPHLIYLSEMSTAEATRIAVGPGSYFQRSTSEMTRMLAETREVEKDVGREILWPDLNYFLLTAHDRNTPISERISSLVQAKSDINRGSSSVTIGARQMSVTIVAREDASVDLSLLHRHLDLLKRERSLHEE
jgi:hypothetical protein